MLGGRCRTSDTNVALKCKVVALQRVNFDDASPITLVTTTATWGGPNDVDGYPTTYSFNND